MPCDSEVVGVINIRQILDSPALKKEGLAELKKALKANEEATKILAAVGLDPFKDLDSVLFTSVGSPPKMLVVVRGRFNLDKIHTAAADFAEKNKDLKITTEGGRKVYDMTGGDKPMSATFLDKNTVLASPDRDYLLDVAKNGPKKGKIHDDLKTAMDKVSGKESIWVAAVITEEMKKGM